MRKIGNTLVLLVIISFCIFAKDVNAVENNGSGTVDDPYLISSLEQLQAIDSPDITAFTYYKLTQDLDFSEITSWDAITISNVAIDGDNHKLIGLSGRIFDGSRGLFNRANNQVIIKNLEINADLEFTNPNAAVILGMTSLGAEVIFENCHVSGSIISSSNGVGAFLGNLVGSVNIIDSSIKIDLTTQGYTGGYIGRVSNGTNIYLDNCLAEGNINVTPSNTTHVQTGGIIGYVQAATSMTLKNIFNYLNINSSGNVGCFIGDFPSQSAFVSENLYNATVVTNPMYTVYPIGENISAEYASLPAIISISGGNLNDYQDLLYSNQLVGKKWVIRDISDSFSITFAPDADLSGLAVYLDSEAIEFTKNNNTITLDFSIDQHKLLFCFSEPGKSSSVLFFDFVFQYTPLPIVQLEHDEETITVTDGEVLYRDEMLEGNIYYLSFAEMAAETEVIVKVNGERTFTATEENRYLLIIENNSQIEITFSQENHLLSTFTFSILVIYSLEELVDTSQEFVSVANNPENPWKRNPEELTRAAFSPSKKTSSAFTVTVSAASGILVFYYKIDNPSSNSSNKLNLYVNDELKENFYRSDGWAFCNIPLSGVSEYLIRFEVIIGDAGTAFAVQLADIIYSEESEYLIHLGYDASMGRVTALVDGQPLNIHPSGNIVGVGQGIMLSAEPNVGYIFVGWKDGTGNIISTERFYGFVFKEELALTAVFLDNFAVARIKDVGYDSLQAALAAAVHGDVVILLRDHTLEEDIVIPSGVMLLLPCSETDDSGYVESGFNPDGTKTSGYREELYRSLWIDAGVTVSVYGTILVNAVTGVPSGGHTVQGITGGYAQIILDGEIMIYEGGLLDCFGKVSGQGTIEVLNGGAVGDLYIVQNWRGGTQALTAYTGGVFPFNEYDCHNITTAIIIHSAAAYYGNVKMYETVFDTYHYTRFYQFDQDLGLIKLASGAYVIKTYDLETGITTITINGGAEEIGGAMVIADMPVTTRDFFYPVDGDIRFVLENGEYLINNRIKFLTGTSLTIAENASLYIKTGAKLVFYQEFIDAPNTASTEYPLRNPAELHLLGTLRIEGALGGDIIAYDAARIIIGSAADLRVVSKETSGYWNNPGFQIVSYDIKTSIGILNHSGYRVLWYYYDNAESEENAVPVDEAYENNNEYFNLYADQTAYRDKTFFVAGVELVAYEINYENLEGAVNNNPSSYTIIDETILLNAPTKAGYDFGGWYLDQSLTQPIVQISQGSFGNLKIYAKWVLQDPILTLSGYTGPVTYGEIVELYGSVEHGLESITYQWYQLTMDGFVAIAGETTPFLRLTNVSQSGIYQIVVSVSDGKETKTAAATIEVVINRALIAMTGITMEDTDFTYDGKTHQLSFSGVLPAGAVFEGYSTNNQLINVGRVTVTATFRAEANYLFDINNANTTDNGLCYILTAVLEVKPLTLTVNWHLDEYIYNPAGQEEIIAEVNTVDGPLRLEVKILGLSGPALGDTSFRNAGDYLLKAVFPEAYGTKENYLLVSNEREAMIQKARITDLVFNNQTYVYDGFLHRPAVSGTLPDEITVIYTYNGLSQNQPFAFSEAGSYQVRASFRVSDNYVEIEDLFATITINKANPTVSSWPTASAIFVGQKLSASILQGGYANVAGEFVWETPEIMPASGMHSYTVHFLPANSNYHSLTDEINVEIIQLYVFFRDDAGERAIAVDYASFLALEEFPTVTLKMGYEAHWDREEALSGITENIVVTALYDIITYTISYELNGGEAVNPLTYNVNSEFTLTNPTWEGHTFTGWTGSGLDEAALIVTVPKGTTGILQYTANWRINTYVLEVASNDEDMGAVNVLVAGNPGYHSGEEVTFNQTVTAEATPAPGYQFIGWYAGQKLVSVASTYLFVMPAANYTLTARFTALDNIQYVIEYYQEDFAGNYQLFQSTILYGKTGTYVVAEEIVITGFTLNNDHPDNLFSGYISGDSGLVLKLYYSRNTYQVRFLHHNGEEELIQIKYYQEDVYLFAPVKEGYAFAGWSYADVIYNPGSTFKMPAEHLELNAVWSLDAPVVIISGYTGPVTYGEVIVLQAQASHSFNTFSYQWYKNGELIDGANATEISLANVNDSGIYRVLVSVSDGEDIAFAEASVEVSIQKATYHIDIAFTSKTVVYTATAQSITVSGNLPAGVSVSYTITANTGSTLTGGKAVNVGEYTVEASFQGDSANYHPIADVYATLKITPMLLDIHFTGYSNLMYDGTVKRIGAEITNALDENLQLLLTGHEQTNAGTYQARVTGLSGAAAGNYRLPETGLSCDYEIQKAVITGIFLNNETFVYDGNAKMLRVNTDRSQYGEQMNVSYNLLGRTDCGSYEVNATLTHPNYHSLVLQATMRIIPRSLIVELGDQSSVYGEAINVRQNAWNLASDSPYDLVPGQNVQIVITKENGIAAGEYLLEATHTNPNYEILFRTGYYRITPRPLIVTILNQSGIYNGLEPVVDQSRWSYSGTFGSGDSPSVLKIALQKESGYHAGIYALTGTWDNPNYAVSFVNGTYEITTRVLEVEFEEDSLYTVYDGRAHIVRTILKNVIGNDNVGVILTYSGADAAVNAGVYLVEVSGINNSDYQLARTPAASLTIAKRPLTIKADDITSLGNEAEKALTYSLYSASEAYRLPEGVGLTVNLARENAGEKIVGKIYRINIQSYVFNDGNEENFIIQTLPGNYLFQGINLEIRFTDNQFVYDGTAKKLAFSCEISGIDEEVFVIRYYHLGQEIAASEVVDAGTYQVRLALHPDYRNQYSLTMDGVYQDYLEYQIVISKRDITELITIQKTEQKYDGRPVQTIPVVFTGLSEEITYTWKDENGVEVEMINAGTYHIRIIIEDQNYLGVSEIFTYRINKADNTRIPSISNNDLTVTKHTISISGSEDLEYSLDNLTWQKASVFTGLVDAEVYVIYVRYSESTNYLPSPSSLIEVQTLGYQSFIAKVEALSSDLLADYALLKEAEELCEEIPGESALLSADVKRALDKFEQAKVDYAALVAGVNRDIETVQNLADNIAVVIIDVVQSLSLLAFVIGLCYLFKRFFPIGRRS